MPFPSHLNVKSKQCLLQLLQKSIKPTAVLSDKNELTIFSESWFSYYEIACRLQQYKMKLSCMYSKCSDLLAHQVINQSLSTSSRTLQTFTQQETITPCLLFILQSIYLHNLSPHLSSQPITSRTYQRLLYLLTNQIAHQGFWIFNWLTLPLDSENGFRTGCRNVSH